MKIKYTIQKTALLACLLFCFFSCQKSTSDKNLQIFEKFPEQENVKLTNVFEFKNGKPDKLFIIDSSLIIYDANGKSSSFFYNYSLKKGALSSGYVKGGRGPGEAIGAFSAGITQNILWLYDISLKKVITFKLGDVLKQNKPLPFKEYPIKDFYYQIDFKDSLSFVSVGNPQSKKKIQEIDLKSQKNNVEFGEFTDVPTDIPFDAYKSSQQCFVLTSPSGNKTALFYRYTDKIEIFDNQKHTGVASQGPENFKADLDVMKLENENIAIRNKNTRFAFINGTVTDKYIYVLFSGGREGDTNFDSSNSVYVYNWDGNPVKKLSLDRYISSITVSQDDKSLYAYDPNSGYIIQSKINN